MCVVCAMNVTVCGCDLSAQVSKRSRHCQSFTFFINTVAFWLFNNIGNGSCSFGNRSSLVHSVHVGYCNTYLDPTCELGVRNLVLRTTDGRMGVHRNLRILHRILVRILRNHGCSSCCNGPFRNRCCNSCCRNIHCCSSCCNDSFHNHDRNHYRIRSHGCTSCCDRNLRSHCLCCNCCEKRSHHSIGCCSCRSSQSHFRNHHSHFRKHCCRNRFGKDCKYRIRTNRNSPRMYQSSWG
mmetsp:Transcript_26973/g.40823  ORF Transcript_26973/g.40823 Transcript_26973/m.40823 type:complete len:237 (-) Transcript_26973:176-886(-)